MEAIAVHGEQARLVLYDREMHLDIYGPVVVGESFDVVRGNGIREGDRMGTATIVAIDDGCPILDVRLDAGARL